MPLRLPTPPAPLFRAPRLAAAAAALALCAAAPALADPMTLQDVPRIQAASGVAVAPDGETAAYLLSVPRDVAAGDEDGPADTHIYLVRDGGEPEAFVQGEGRRSGLAFSEDGETLYFRDRRGDDKTTALYSISLSGGEAGKLFEFETSIGDYAVSEDGDTLYFAATAKRDSDSGLARRGFNAKVYEEQTPSASLWRVDLSADDAEAEILFEGVDVNALELSPSGDFLVIAAAPTGLVDDYYMKSRLHVIDAESGERRVTVETPGKLGAFEISPDNERIAFLAGTDQGDTSDGVLMVADVESGEFRQLTADAEQHIEDLEWLSDNRILANAHRGVETELVVYDPRGREQRTLRTPDDIVVRQLGVGGDGGIFFTADSPNHPAALFSQDGRRTEKLSDHNAWLEETDLFRQETYSYEARDGTEIEGLLITPEGDPPEAGWPLILVVHGGPEAHYSDGWLTAYSQPGQYGAAQGYAVFYPNYRGSTGRGVAFSKEHQDDYAGKEFDDLVDGVEALVEAGIADEDRVGITGGSYGGYASMWGATAQSETFAAAVPFVGISNQISKFGTSDIPNEMHLVHSLRWPWEAVAGDGGEGEDNEGNWMNLLKRSPIYHVGDATTPTLILHGERDTRVHPGQSLELYRSMKVRTDTPVRLVLYPNEGHGNRNAAARLDYSVRLMRWMDTYLAEGASRDDPMPPFEISADAYGLDD